MMRSTRRSALLGLACLGLTLGCNLREAPQDPPVRAELGVFFGGQVQERDEIPFTLDRTQQTQGFRLTFREPSTRPSEVRWEIDRPGPRGRGRAVELGDVRTRVGQAVFDREILFRPGDPLGTWNIRVFVDGAAVIDRSVSVYDGAARRRARGERASLMKQKR